MNNMEIFLLINRIISEKLSFNTDGISEEQTLESIGIDSIGVMTLIVYLEEELDISIDFDSNWPVEITSISIKEFINNISRIVEAKQ